MEKPKNQDGDGLHGHGHRYTCRQGCDQGWQFSNHGKVHGEYSSDKSRGNATKIKSRTVTLLIIIERKRGEDILG